MAVSGGDDEFTKSEKKGLVNLDYGSMKITTTLLL